MPNLVGIGNSQVPTNAMLGGLAYQDPDNAIFTKVEPGLVSAIKARSQETVTDIFVYDTKLDSDGGAWRYKCQDKSWYTEELGRDGRGQRKEFPSLAVIAVANGGDGLIIYDGDDPNLSVWMTFKELAGQSIWSSANRTGVCAKNGMIVATQDATIPAVFIDLITDEYYNWRTTTSNFRYNYTHIGNRNDASVTFGMKDYFDGHIAAGNMKCVDMMVEHDAPIDPERGLPRPTIALGGLGSLTILRGTWSGASPSRWVVRNSDVDNNYQVDKIKFDDTGGVIAVNNSSSSSNLGVVYVNSSHTLGGHTYSTYASWQEVYYYYNYSPSVSQSANVSRNVNTVRMGTSAKGTIAAMKGRDFAFSSNSGLNLIERANFRGNSKNFTSGSASTHSADSLGVYITKDFNSGWMTIGTNSDNTYRNTQVLACPAHKYILGPEASRNLVINGDASNGTNGWGGGGGGTFSVSSGVFSYNITSGNHQITQQITGLTVGKKYKFTYTHKTGTTSAYIGQHGSSAAPNMVMGDRTGNSDQTVSLVWVATITNPYVVVYGIGSGTHTWDNVSLVETYDLGTHRNGNHVLNGDFKISGNTSGWTGAQGGGSGANAVLSIVSDGNYKSIKVHDAGNDGNFARGQYNIYRLVVGRRYVFSASFRGSSHSTIVTLGGANGDNSGWKSANSNDVWTNYFNATSTDLLITLQTASNAGAHGKWDQIKLYEVEDNDVTRNAKGLGAQGLIRTSPVAENAELHYYHGFSLNNYLVQPYNADLAYGSHPNFTISCWIKGPSTAPNSYQCAMHWNRHANVSGESSIHGWQMMINNSNIPYFYIYDQGGVDSSVAAYGTIVEPHGWTHLAAVGNLGKHLTLYQNGRATGISRNVWNGFDWDGTFGEAQQLSIGRYGGSNTSNYHLRGGICMIKIQRCALSGNRIRRIYDDEKQLFTNNAKCTLHGTSDTILGTAYDRITDTLSVGTSSGRSDFRGLRRVNSTDTAITTCISSSDGLIAEQ